MEQPREGRNRPGIAVKTFPDREIERSLRIRGDIIEANLGGVARITMFAFHPAILAKREPEDRLIWLGEGRRAFLSPVRSMVGHFERADWKKSGSRVARSRV